jgi:hypothetical protein
MLLLYADATQVSLNDPEAGLGLHRLKGWAQQWLAWKLKSRTQYLNLANNLCFYSLTIVAKDKNCFGPKLEPNGQITVKILLYGGNVFVRSDTVILADRNLARTVRRNYGRCRNYGPKFNITA